MSTALTRVLCPYTFFFFYIHTCVMTQVLTVKHVRNVCLISPKSFETCLCISLWSYRMINYTFFSKIGEIWHLHYPQCNPTADGSARGSGEQ